MTDLMSIRVQVDLRDRSLTGPSACERLSPRRRNATAWTVEPHRSPRQTSNLEWSLAGTVVEDHDARNASSTLLFQAQSMAARAIECAAFHLCK
jgi:hypothetical protein